MGARLNWQHWVETIVCPACHGYLSADESKFQCQECYRVYRVRDGIPYFVDLETLGEFEQEESEFHSIIAEQADSAHGQATLRTEYLHNDFLAPVLDLAPGAMILDVACGSGVDVVRLVEKGYRVVGVDIAPGMIRTTQRKVQELGLADRVFLCVAAADQLPFAERSFQAAYISAALHHMRYPATVLGELARVTRSSGTVSIGSEPNAWIYRFRSLKHSKLGRRVMGLLRDDYTVGEQPPGDRTTVGWSIQDWSRIVKGTGLEVERITPIWYLSGLASLLGLHSPPRWLETVMCEVDKHLAGIPLVKYYSMKWNVITRKKDQVGV